MSLNDIEKAKKAVVNMFVDHEIDEVLDDVNEVNSIYLHQLRES